MLTGLWRKINKKQSLKTQTTKFEHLGIDIGVHIAIGTLRIQLTFE